MDAQRLVDVLGDAIVAADAEGRITVWNPAAERLFGFSQSEAMGRSLDLIIPERFRDRHWHGYEEVMRSGVTRYGGAQVLRVPALRKDGRPLSIAFTVGLVLASDGRVESIVAVVRDDTERWNEERILRKRLAQAEGKPQQ
jgi:PAS domain S-box-containing protein